MTSNIARKPSHDGHFSRCERFSNVGRGKDLPGKHQKGMKVKNEEKKASQFAHQTLTENSRSEAIRARLQQKILRKIEEREARDARALANLDPYVVLGIAVNRAVRIVRL